MTNLQPLQFKLKCIHLDKDAIQIDKGKINLHFFSDAYQLAIIKNIKSSFIKSLSLFLKASIKKSTIQISKLLIGILSKKK
jgi:hypothetical protein